MNLLITGGLGHIGSFLMRKINNSIKVSNITIVDSMQTQRYASLFHLPSEPKFTFIEKKVATLSTNDFIINGKVDCVIHLAATTDASGTAHQSEELFQNNLGSTKAIIKLCGELEIPLIFPSTTSVYGSQSKLVDETCTELLPQSPYAECKLEEEREVLEATKVGLNAVVLRFGTIHGVSPGMRFHTAVNKFCFQVASGASISVWRTALNQKRPYLGLTDASNAIAHVITNSLFNGEIYNVLTNNHTVAEIVSTIETSTSKKCAIELVDSEIMNQLSYEVSNDKFISTGFEFLGNLQADVRETMTLLDGIHSE